MLRLLNHKVKYKTCSFFWNFIGSVMLLTLAKACLVRLSPKGVYKQQVQL